MAKRRTARQIAATAALVASNKARQAGAVVVRQVRSAPTRVRTVYRNAVASARAPRRARRAAIAIARGGGALAIAQARILPSAVGGYLVAKVERDQRARHAASVVTDASGKAAGGGALIKDPRNRLLAELAVVSFGASRTSGMVREVMCGMAGGIGYAFESYMSTADKDGNGANPVDGYRDAVLRGEAGV